MPFYLRELRKARRLSQHALAVATGYNQKHLSALETGDRGKAPSFQLVIDLAEFFGIHPRHLAFGPRPADDPHVPPIPTAAYVPIANIRHTADDITDQLVGLCARHAGMHGAIDESAARITAALNVIYGELDRLHRLLLHQ